MSALGPLLQQDALEKVRLTLALDASQCVDASAVLAEPPGVPGRPTKPVLVSHVGLSHGSLRTPDGRAALIHSIAHIELNAVDLALDLCWRFPGMPDQFYREWVAIAKEEAQHFTMLREHLVSMGYDYGSFDAHNALWEMAERTKADILARVALVPRTLEARGLDASPAVKRKLVGAGDHKVGEILDVILLDEIGHVACGNRWYRYLCDQRGLDPIGTYAMLVTKYQAPKLRAPFNLDARRKAGFDDAELEALQS